MNPDEISNIIQAVSVTFASLAIVVGVDAWRREFIGKRKIELAEDVLHAFYEARDAISRIRFPVMTQSEVEEVRKEFKDAASSAAVDQARAVFTRYDKESDVFNRLLLGVFESSQLVFVAKVKNGFVPRIRDELFAALKALQTASHDKCGTANVCY